MRNLVAREGFQGVLTYHSFSQLILYPWGYRSNPIDDVEDRTAMRHLAEKMQQLIRDVHDKEYQAIQAFQDLRRASLGRYIPTGPGDISHPLDYDGASPERH